MHTIRRLGLVFLLFFCTASFAFADEGDSLRELKQQKRDLLIQTIIDAKKSCSDLEETAAAQKECLRENVKNYFKAYLKEVRKAKRACSDLRGDANAYQVCYLTEYFDSIVVGDDSAESGFDFADITTDAFEEAECPFELPSVKNKITCGFVTAPENYREPDQEQIKLAVAILHSKTQNKEEDPVFYLQGGPSVPLLTTEQVEFWSNVSLLDDRDIVLYDQRGVGYSEPKLACEEYDRYLEAVSKAEEPEQLLATELDALQDCFARIKEAGNLIEYYSTRHSAHDIESIRNALGYDKISVYGISYGTRLALAYAQEYPSSLRGVIIDSVLTDGSRFFIENPLFFEGHLNKIFALCKEDEACDSAYPDLENSFYRLLKELKKNPREVEFVDPETGEADSYELNDEVFLLLIKTLVNYDIEDSAVPFAIHNAMENKDHEMLSAALVALYTMSGEIDLGAHFAVSCNDSEFQDVQEKDTRAKMDPRLAPYFEENSIYTELCKNWPHKAQTLIFDDEIASVPTLVFSGENDSITPPAYGEAMHAKLPNSQHVILAGAGHGASVDRQCSMAMISDFLANTSRDVENKCTEKTKSMSFLIVDSEEKDRVEDAHCFRTVRMDFAGEIKLYHPLDEDTAQKTACYHPVELGKEDGIENFQLYYLRNNKSQIDPYFGVASVWFEVNHEEGTQTLFFFDDYGEITEDFNGVEGEFYRYWQGGVTVGNINREGELIKDDNGVHYYVRELDSAGNIISSARYNIDEERIYDQFGIYEKRYEYDDYGHLSKIMHYDAQGRLVDNRNGIAIREYKNNVYDEYTRALFFDKDHNPVNDSDGIAKIERDINSDGNVLEVRYFDRNGDPVRDADDGVAIIKYVYDEYGNKILESYFDESGKPTEDTETGVSMIKWGYSDIGAQIEKTFHGKDGELKAYGEGKIAIIRNRYNRSGGMVEESYFGEDGEPTTDEYGIFRMEFKSNRITYYDQNNRQFTPNFGDTE